MNAFTVDDSMGHSRRMDGTERCWAVARQWVLGLSLAFACEAALAQAMYRIKPLGLLGGCTSARAYAYGVNSAGQVTGTACNAHGDFHAFLWRNDGTPMVDLGPPKIGSYSEAVALNASGLVAGYVNTSAATFAFVSRGDGTPMRRLYDSLGGTVIYPTGLNDLGQMTGSANTGSGPAHHAVLWKNDGSPIRDLGTLGGDTSAGGAINASGQVTGGSYLPDNVTRHAFIWKNDGTPMVDLGTLGGDSSSGRFINASAQIAGYSALAGSTTETHAFFWRNDGTPMQDPGTLGGRSIVIVAFNDSGQLAGDSDAPTGHHAFVWMNNGTPMKDLGTFGGTFSYAHDMNSSGQVTGEADFPGNGLAHAFLWRNDGTQKQDLNKLIDATDPLKPYVTLYAGDLINDFGDIVAEGPNSRTGVYGLYLLQGTVLTLAPRSLAFGNQPINTTSAAKSVTVTNTSAKVVAITSIALKGSNPGQFASTNNCGSSLVGHATCTIKVTFKPTTKGAKSALLNVNGGGGGLRTVTLTGTGT
jgi:probable HAF family extracellular repeat protein